MHGVDTFVYPSLSVLPYVAFFARLVPALIP